MNSVLWPTIKKGRRPLLGNGQRPPGLGGSSQIPRQIWRFLWGLRPGIPAPKSGGIRSSPLGLAKAAGYKGHRAWTRRNSEPHDHGRTRWAFGRNPRLTIKSVKIWAGPSRRPSGINALTFGRAKIVLKALYRNPSATAGWEQTTYSCWPGGSRGSRFRIQRECDVIFPSEPPGAEVGSVANLQQRT